MRRLVLGLFLVASLLLLPTMALAEDPPPAEPPAEETPVAEEPPAAEPPPVVEQPVAEAPPTEAALLFSEDFSTNDAGWTTDSGSDFKRFVQDGQYHIVVTRQLPPNYIGGWWFIGSSPKLRVPPDFVFQFDAGLAAGSDRNDYGVIFRSTADAKIYYKFTLSGTGTFRFSHWSGDREVDIVGWTRSPAVRPGKAMNTVKIVAKGSNFTFFVNDVDLGTYTDRSLARGGIALFAGTSQVNPGEHQGVHAVFDNVQLWQAN